MLTITSPYVQFTELDGSPLDDGAVYIGTAGLNAETNPITVYWDNAGTQPAAQPIKTRSGVVARNGSPARVYVNAGVYSITVRDKMGRLLASELSISSSVDASGITDGTIAEVKLDSALAAKINGALQKSGGTMTGAIVLPGNATNALEAVPKQQAQDIADAAAASAASDAVSDRLRFQRIAQVATTSGGSVALSTAIPSWAKEIDIVFAGVSINTANSILVRVGSGGLATSGYASTSTTANNASATSAFSSTTGFAVELAGDPPNALRGTMRLIKLDDSANTWVQSHSMTKNSNNSLFGGGEITLAGALTHISLVCNVGGDVFDAGSAAIVVKGWEL